jgi:DNA polymerase
MASRDGLQAASIGGDLDYLHDLGRDELNLSPLSPAPQTSPEASSPASPESLSVVSREAAACTRCRLATGRQSVVFGSGSATADLMLIGEGPGAEEDKQGLPFVGPAGELLTKILAAIKLSREQVYIANVVKCRPPGNRNPQPDEIAACAGFLTRQIQLVGPKLIVLLGRVAAQALLESDQSLGGLRGRWHQLLGIPTRVTYHPAALLRQASYKRPTWEDMKLVRDRLQALSQGG